MALINLLNLEKESREVLFQIFNQIDICSSVFSIQKFTTNAKGFYKHMSFSTLAIYKLLFAYVVKAIVFHQTNIVAFIQSQTSFLLMFSLLLLIGKLNPYIVRALQIVTSLNYCYKTYNYFLSASFEFSDFPAFLLHNSYSNFSTQYFHWTWMIVKFGKVQLRSMAVHFALFFCLFISLSFLKMSPFGYEDKIAPTLVGGFYGVILFLSERIFDFQSVISIYLSDSEKSWLSKQQKKEKKLQRKNKRKGLASD